MLRSLHYRLALLVSGGALVLAVASALLLYTRNYEASLEASERSVAQLLETVKNTASIAAYVRNAELARQVVDGLALNDLVLSARVLGEGDFDVTSGELPGRDSRGEVSIDLEAPFTPDELVGTLSVHTDRALIVQRARSTAATAAVVLVAQTFVVAFLVLVAVYLMLTRPLVEISAGLHRIVPGEKNRLRLRSGTRAADELDVLTDDINALLGTVERMLVEERGLRERVQALEQRFRGIFESTSAGIFLASTSGRLVTANPAFFRTVGATEAELLAEGVDCFERVFADREAVQRLVAGALETRHASVADLNLRVAECAEPVWVHVLFSPGTGGDGATLVEGVIYDITQRKRAEEQTRARAELDHLTGLPNRHSAELRLAQQLQQAQANTDTFAMALLDLDRFKQINDTHGHDAGDRVLVETARRLRAAVRESDYVARLGGDEFLLLLPGAHSPETTRRVCLQLVQKLGEPIDLGAGVLDRVGASIGVAFFPHHGTDAEGLRVRADAAMYAVKRAGRNGMAIYSPDGQHTVQML